MIMRPAKSQEAETDKAAGPLYGVLDTLCVPGKTRTHEILKADGEIAYYVFEANKQVRMPHAHAVKFQRDAAFKVFNPAGDLQSTTPHIHPLQVQATDVKLKDGQTIATFEELKREALLTRVYLFPGGDRFKSTAKSEDLIRFLKGLAPVADRIAAAADAGEDDPEDVLSNDELDTLLPKQGLFQGDAA